MTKCGDSDIPVSRKREAIHCKVKVGILLQCGQLTNTLENIYMTPSETSPVCLHKIKVTFSSVLLFELSFKVVHLCNRLSTMF